MAQLTTKVERSFLENGKEVIEFKVPAIGESAAERNALGNARLKGMDEPEITEVENIGASGVPGRSLFLVTVEAMR